MHRSPREERPDLLHICFGGLGGHAGVVAPLDAALHRRGLRTCVVRYAPADQLRDDEGWVSLPSSRRVVKRGRVDVIGLSTLAGLVRRLAPRAVLCHAAIAAGPAAIGQLLGGQRPHVGLVEHQALGLRSTTYELSSLLALPFVSGIVVLTDDYAARYPLRRLPLGKVRRPAVIPSGIDLGVFGPAPGRGERSGALRVGMTCRLVPGKDVATLVRSLPSVLERLGPGRVVLRIAGDGTERASLERLIRQLGLEPSVELVGALDQTSVVRFLQGLDVYVQSTYGESGATALLQAYATGLAVVGSDVEGVRSIIRDGVDGLLVPVNDPALLAATLVDLLEDEARRASLGRAARARAEADFGAELMAQRYLGFLDQLDPLGPWAAASDAT